MYSALASIVDVNVERDWLDTATAVATVLSVLLALALALSAVVTGRRRNVRQQAEQVSAWVVADPFEVGLLTLQGTGYVRNDSSQPLHGVVVYPGSTALRHASTVLIRSSWLLASSRRSRQVSMRDTSHSRSASTSPTTQVATGVAVPMVDFGGVTITGGTTGSMMSRDGAGNVRSAQRNITGDPASRPRVQP